MSGQKRLRGGVLGCGMISEFHLRGWQRIADVEIVALADPNPTASEARRQAYAPAARCFPDLASMLAGAELDFIDIITPPVMHAEHCLAAKAASLHVICQKPLCLDLDEAARLVDAMSKPGPAPRLFAVHENHRFRPWFEEVRRRHAEGFFGRLRYLRIDQLDPFEPKEAFKCEAERGVLLEYGTHLIDMVRVLLGEPRSAFARGHRQNPRVRGESMAHVVFEHDDATSIVDVAWKAAGLHQGGFVLIGDKGEAVYEGRLTRDAAARFRLVSGNEVIVEQIRSPTDDYVESFYKFERDVTEAMLTGRSPQQTGLENLRTLEATFASYRSMAEGRVVRIP